MPRKRRKLLRLMGTIRQRAPILAGRGTVSAATQVNPAPPVFTVAPTSYTNAVPGTTTIQFTAVDPNGQAVSYSLVGSPANYSINASTGLVSVQMGALALTLTVRATDTTGLSSTTTCSVTVQAQAGGWPTQATTYLPALRNRSGFAMATRHAFTGGNPTIYRVTAASITNNTPLAAAVAVGDGTYRCGFLTAWRASGARIIVFEASGVINLNNEYQYMGNGSLWVACQTAPAPGITFINGCLAPAFGASNILLQHVRNHRQTSGSVVTNVDSFNVDGGGGTVSNIILDHCDLMYASDENLNFYRDVATADVIECVLAWGLLGYNVLFDSNALASAKVSMQGNVLAHTITRNPMSSAANLLYANNINFDCGDGLWHNETNIPTRQNLIGNRFKKVSTAAPIVLWGNNPYKVGYGNSTYGAWSTYDGVTKLWIEGNYLGATTPALVADQTTTIPPTLVQNLTVFSAATLKAAGVIDSAKPAGWVGWSDNAGLETYLIANAGAYPHTARSTATTKVFENYANNVSNKVTQPNWADASLTVNSQTFVMPGSYGASFFADSLKTGDSVGGVTRRAVESYLLDLGEAA